MDLILAQIKVLMDQNEPKKDQKCTKNSSKIQLKLKLQSKTTRKKNKLEYDMSCTLIRYPRAKALQGFSPIKEMQRKDRNDVVRFEIDFFQLRVSKFVE